MGRAIRFAVILVCGLALAGPMPASAHGTKEPGPNGGEIRMPGAFHVEVVARDDALRLYVLDMQFEQPRTENSSVSAKLRQGGTTVALDCRDADHAPAFTCPLPADASLQQGTLVVDASRDGMPAEPATYELPLAFGQ